MAGGPREVRETQAQPLRAVSPRGAEETQVLSLQAFDGFEISSNLRRQTDEAAAARPAASDRGTQQR